MTVYYLDTSALMKRYRPEAGSDVVGELFEGLVDSEALTTSQLTVLEANSAAGRLLEGREITRDEYQRMLERLDSDIAYYDITVTPVENELVIEATGIVREYSLRTLDALHFTSAVIVSRALDNQDLCMVSADREVIEASESYGIPTLDPQDGDALSRLGALR